MLQRLERWHWVVLVMLVVFTGVMLMWPTNVPPTPNVLPEAPVVDVRGLPSTYDSSRASFTVRYRGIQTDLRLMSVFVMPGEAVDFSVAAPAQASVELNADSGSVSAVAEHAWRWTAPERQGLYRLQFQRAQTRDLITLQAFVKVPLHPDSLSINGYRIGTYQREPYRDNPFYAFPDGFVEVRPSLLEERVSPHFILGQFVAKQVSNYPKYLRLDERLLLKLELLLELVNREGVRAHTLHVMSGFRTPHYNRLIGNTTSYSVHLYGGAADVFVDVDDDTYMDDINEDGAVDVTDAQMLAELIETRIGQRGYEHLVGGLGVYAPASHRGPFVHLDVRGEPARW